MFEKKNCGGVGLSYLSNFIESVAERGGGDAPGVDMGQLVNCKIQDIGK